MMSTSTMNSSLFRFLIILISVHAVDLVALTSATKTLNATSSDNLVKTTSTTHVPTDHRITAPSPSDAFVPTIKTSANLVPVTRAASTAAHATTPSATLVPTTTLSATLVPTTTSSATLVLTPTSSATLVPTTTPSATLVPATTITSTAVSTTTSSATHVPTTLVPNVTFPATAYTNRHMSETPAPTAAFTYVTALTITMYVLTALLVLENILIIVIIRKTKYLRSHTGTLLISQTCADIVFYFTLQCQYFPQNESKNDPYEKMKETCYIVSLGLIGVTIMAFAAMSFNLYMAVCHSDFYRKHMKKGYVILFIVISWVVNLSLPFTRLANFTTRTNQKSGDIILVYVPSHAWSWMMCDIVVYGLPPFVNAVSSFKIWKYVRKIQAIPSSNINLYEKVKVTQFTSGTCLCYILASVFSHIFRVLYGTLEPWPERVGPFRILWLSFSSFLFVYHFLKIVIYMCLYQPFRHTISLMCRKERDGSRD